MGPSYCLANTFVRDVIHVSNEISSVRKLFLQSFPCSTTTEPHLAMAEPICDHVFPVCFPAHATNGHSSFENQGMKNYF